MFIRQQMISFLIAFLMVFFTILADAKAIDNPVVPNGKLGEFRHGTFPSLGERTHIGVDIVASCGSDIYAFADGRVKDVINNKNDKNFKALGYMVLIEHPASLTGKTFYTLYLHMQGPPVVKIGNQVKGGKDVIGKVGDTGTAYGCNTHFEIRYFPERLSKWGNIYGSGDQRASEYFRQNWEDPIAFFEKYPEGIRLDKSANDPSNKNISKTKTGLSKGIPVYIENLVFGNPKFSRPISKIIPCEDAQGEAESIKRSEMEADREYLECKGRRQAFKLCLPRLIIYSNCLEVAGHHLSRSWLNFLIKNDYARIEEFVVYIRRDKTEKKFKLFHYNDKIRPYILRQSERGSALDAVLDISRDMPINSSEIILASRKLKSIDYINQYEGTLPGTGAKTQFYALTFSYTLEEKFPGLPNVDKVYKGKAKAVLDPDDGQWKLWGGDIELEDSGSSEYTKLIEQQYKEFKTGRVSE